MATDDVQQFVTTVPLIDHHCHSVVAAELDRADLESLITESDWPPADGRSNFDSPVGVAIRALCAPILDLPRHATADAYVSRRIELGAEEVNRRQLRATGIGRYLIETGVSRPDMLSVNKFQEAADAPCSTLARLEVIAEGLLTQCGSAREFLDRLPVELDAAVDTGLGFKSVVAYRCGLDFDPDRPTEHEVLRAVEEVLAGRTEGSPVRLGHPVVIRHLLWQAVDRGRPLQMHIGYGDSDIDLHRCDPSKMTEFIRRTRTSGTDIMLLHCYPFQREAAFLAQVYPHVYLDTGAAVNYTGFGSTHVVRESLELAPFHKILFSSDAYGLPELYLCGALLWRRAMGQVFGEWVRGDHMSLGDAHRYIEQIAFENAEQVYAL